MTSPDYPVQPYTHRNAMQEDAPGIMADIAFTAGPPEGVAA